ncbi:hypothetical protein Tco_0597751 [Tanacetum coccineum]
MDKRSPVNSSSWKSIQAQCNKDDNLQLILKCVGFALDRRALLIRKTFKEAWLYQAWIEAMQEELHQFDRLQSGNSLTNLLARTYSQAKVLWKNKKEETKLSYALRLKPCQGDSLNLPDHRIHKDGDGDASFHLETDALPHSHSSKLQRHTIKHQDCKNHERLRLRQRLPTNFYIQDLPSKISRMFKLQLEPLAPRLKCSTSKYGSKPTSNKRNDRISQTPCRNMKNKVAAQPRKVNKKNRVIEPIHDVDVKHSLLKANFEPSCASCKKSMFDGVHDMCRTFTIVGNLCPLTRITSANVEPAKKTTSHLVETQKPELKVYNRKPKNVKNVGSSKKAKIVESKNANHSEPNHTWDWGSNATDIPSSSSLIMTGCPDCSLVSGLRMFETHDREPLSAHELY